MISQDSKRQISLNTNFVGEKHFPEVKLKLPNFGILFLKFWW